MTRLVLIAALAIACSGCTTKKSKPTFGPGEEPKLERAYIIHPDGRKEIIREAHPGGTAADARRRAGDKTK